MKKIKEIYELKKYGEIICNINYDDYLKFTNDEQCKEWGFSHYQNWSKTYLDNMQQMKK